MRTGSENIRILWITERYTPQPGGMAASAYRQVSAMRRRGVEVDVLLFRLDPGATNPSIVRAERDGGRDYIISHAESFGNAAQRAWREIYDNFPRRPYRMIMGFGAGFPGYVAVTFGAFLGIPSMVSVRGNDFDRDWFEPRKAPFVQEALRRADSVATVSLEKKEKIQALFPLKNVFWSPNGVDHRLFELLPKEKEESAVIRAGLSEAGRRVIGIFGELKYKKQIPMFLAALRDRGLRDKVGLLVAGRMDEETDALLKDPVLSPISRHFPFSPPDKLPPLYGACDFIAIPSLFEGFPNVLLEAMAAGVVPIVSDSGAMESVIRHGETGFIFRSINRTDAGEAVFQALSLSDSELEDMKYLVREEVKTRFNLEQEVDILITEIKNTLKAWKMV